MLHLNLFVILRTISSKSHTIDIDNLGILCKVTYIDVLRNFPWVDLSPTAHKILAHAAELVTKNGGKGLGNMSEEGLEACNKLIRRFRASWTLQTSDDANLRDLIKKMWLVSDHYFSSFRKTLKCLKCGSSRHQRKCPVRDILANRSEADILVQEMFLD